MFSLYLRATLQKRSAKALEEAVLKHKNWLFIVLVLLLTAIPGFAQTSRSRVDLDLAKRADKIIICHYPGGDAEKPRELTIALPAWEAHQRGHNPGDVDKEGPCPSEPPPPPVDVCPNLPGNQSSIPDGYELVGGECVLIPPPPVDVCPNIAGDQSEVPSGYQLLDGECVMVPDPPRVIVGCTTEGDANYNPEATQHDERYCAGQKPPDPPVEEPEEEDKKPAKLERFVIDCANPLSAIVGEEEVIPVLGIYSDGTKKPLSSGLRMRYLDGGQGVCIPGKGCLVKSFNLTTIVVEVWVDGLNQKPEEVTVLFFSQPQAPYTSTLGLFASEQQFDCVETITTAVNLPDTYGIARRVDYFVIDPMGVKSPMLTVKVSSADHGALVPLLIEPVDACTKPGEWLVQAYLRDAVGNNLISGAGSFFVKENPEEPVSAITVVNSNNGVANDLLIFPAGEFYRMIREEVIKPGSIVNIALVRSEAFIPLKATLVNDYLQVGPGSQGHSVSLPPGYYTLLVYLETLGGVEVLSQPEEVRVPGVFGRLELN